MTSQIFTLKNILLGILAFILLSGIGLTAAVAGLGMALVDRYSNQWANGDLVPAYNSVVFDRQGKAVAQLHGPENRVSVEFSQIPSSLKKAFLAVEDVRFYEHPGMDIRAIIRAALADFREEELSQGASTITQQLIRNTFLTREKTWLRKIRELVMARELEKRYSKDEIFGMYLNRIYFGNGVYGVQAASRFYFGKNVDKLSLAEAAMLAAIPKNPAVYAPNRNHEAAMERRNLVIAQMEGYHLVSATAADDARIKPLKTVAAQPGAVYRFPYYVDEVVREARERYGITEEQLYRGGYSIFTGLDQRVQGAVETVFQDARLFPPSSGGIQVQGAMAVVDYRQGLVRGLVGGRGYQAVRGFNRATQLRRQPGSAIKPLVVFAPALEKGYPVSYRLDDSPAELDGGYDPGNYQGIRYGSMDMTFALKNSVNLYAVKLLKEIGVDAGFQMGQRLGLPLMTQDRGLSLALGGLTRGVSPLQMAGAFGTFGADGVYREPVLIRQVLDRNGLEVKGRQPQAEQVMSKSTAWIMTALLQEAVNSGTGREARLPPPAWALKAAGAAQSAAGTAQQAAAAARSAPGTAQQAAAAAQSAAAQQKSLAVPVRVYSQPTLPGQPVNWAWGGSAGKTGTVQLPDTPEFRGVHGNKDAWFAGFTPELAAAVWVGFDRTDRSHYLQGVLGGNYPARLWKEAMARIAF